MKKRIIYLSLAIMIAGLFCFKTVYGEDLYSTTLSCSFTFRHNTNGYWYLTGNGGSACVYDSDISAGNFPCSGSAYLLYDLPAEVVSALKEHPELKVRLEHPGICSSIDFDFFNYAFAGPGTLAMELKLKPVTAYHDLNSYVPGLRSPVPLVDYSYGRNIYIVYPLIGEAGRAYGFFSESDPYWISSPYIHPSQIKSSKGIFYPGTTINVDGLNKNAAFYTIGRGSSPSMEEAILLEFFCPLKLVFYLPGEGEPWTPYIPGEGIILPPWWPENMLPEKPFSLRIHRKR